jgi:hypothetical protein
MPYSIIETKKGHYSVINSQTGKIHAKDTTLANAKAQIRLLYGVEKGALQPRAKKRGTK